MRSKTFIAHIRKGMRDSLRPQFKNCEAVAILTGPSPVIEVIVRNASSESGIDMDWGYFSGRAIIYALGNKTEARRALYLSFPKSNLTISDL